MKGARGMAPTTQHQQQRQCLYLGHDPFSIGAATKSRPFSPFATASFSSSTAASPFTKTANVLIVGGGPIGCSTAYHLAKMRGDDGRGIVVVEKDATYAHASATLSAGGIRQQFSLKQNVQMSQYSIDFLRRAQELLYDDEDNDKDTADETMTLAAPQQHQKKDNNPVQLEEHGYLFLASTETGRQLMVQNHETQHRAGATDIYLMSPSELSEKFPWLYTDDILLGSFGRAGEGWFDPWSLIQGLRHKCLKMGVQFVTGSPVGTTRESRATARHEQIIRQVHIEETNNAKTKAKVMKTYHVDHVVNAAGAHCRAVLNTLAMNGSNDTSSTPLEYPIPVYPRKRCIFSFHCPKAEGWIAPLTVCPTTGVYFRSTQGATVFRSNNNKDDKAAAVSKAKGSGSGHFLAGVSPPADQDCNVDFDYSRNNNCSSNDTLFSTTPSAQDYETLFEDVIWPSLYERAPDYFGEIKVQNSWCGMYEYNILDQNGIIDFHPELTNVLMVNGFSGHGLQHSPASGRAAAELLQYNGKFQSLDLSLFNFARLCREKHQSRAGVPAHDSGGAAQSQWPPLVFEQAIV
ncbi:hypothetical protein ACA910_012383 [Epithemia clementina (nom. ined.)]